MYYKYHCKDCGAPIVGDSQKGRCGICRFLRSGKSIPELARRTVTRALLNQKISSGPCEVCGATRNIDAHHDDYRKPLDVRWLCRGHHKLHHAKLRRQAKTVRTST